MYLNISCESQSDKVDSVYQCIRKDAFPLSPRPNGAFTYKWDKDDFHTITKFHIAFYFYAPQSHQFHLIRAFILGKKLCTHSTL